MKQFEYTVEDMAIVDDLDRLDELGEEGWELVCGSELYGKLIFKRPLDTDTSYEEDEDEEDVEKYTPTVISAENYCYEDKNIRLKFKGHEDTTNLFFGEGIGFKFLVENISNITYRITAKNVSLNGFIVSSSELITSEIEGHKKAIVEMYVYFGANNLNDCDIYSSSDVEELSFTLEIEDEILDETYESDNEIIIKI